jgi:hypothetical protein
LLLRASAILSASSDLIASPTNTQKWQASSVLATDTAVISDPFIGGSITGKVDLQAQSAMVANATAQLMRTAVTLSASGNVMALAGALMQASTVLSASSSMTSLGLRYSPSSSVLFASGSLLTSSSFTLVAGAAKLTSTSSLIASSSFQSLAAYAAAHADTSLIANAVQISSLSGIVLSSNSALVANGFVHGPVPTVASRDHSLILSMRKNIVGPPLIILGH